MSVEEPLLVGGSAAAPARGTFDRRMQAPPSPPPAGVGGSGGKSSGRANVGPPSTLSLIGRSSRLCGGARGRPHAFVSRASRVLERKTVVEDS